MEGQSFSTIVAGAWSTPKSQIIFTTLGMVVLDELHFPSNISIANVIGGSGTFSTRGFSLVTSTRT